MFWLLPSPVLKGMVIGGIETQSQDNSISKASDFMAERLNGLDQSVLASRLQINCQPSYVQPHLVNDLPVTILTVFDESALSQEVGLTPCRIGWFLCDPLSVFFFLSR